MDQNRYEKSQSLFRRAVEVIPNGIYGHQSPVLTVPGAFPYYAARAEGCRYWDVDGNEYIDYMCAYGPMILGYGNAKVEAAAEAQRRLGDCLSHPTPAMVELAEYMVKEITFADWAVFAKNGGDLTSWAIQVAREYTGRPLIGMVEGAYHGVQPWCTPGHGGVLDSDLSGIVSFPWNDIPALEALLSRHKGKMAGLIMTPFHHPAFGDSILPAEGYWAKVRALCDWEGMALVLDDVRACCRLHSGGSHAYFGFTPDLTVMCKAIANGYPLSACLGKKELKPAASRVFLSGSYWFSAVPFAAALATLKELKAVNAPAYLEQMGLMLMNGLKELAAAHKLQVYCSGPPAIPFMTFANENDFLRSQLFAAETAARGVFLHPHHNWFLSAAHTEADIKKTLEAADLAFAEVKKKFGG